MAGESTYALVSALIPDIWEGALDYARWNFVAERLVTQFNDMTGKVPRKVSVYTEAGGVTDNLGETADLTATEFDRDLLSTLTPKEIGKQIFLTDIRVESDTENVLVDAIAELGYDLGKKVETDILALFPSLTGGIFGGADTDLTLGSIMNARTRLFGANIPGPYWTVIHPYQYLNIYNTYTDLSKPAPLPQRDVISQNFFISQIADVNIIVTPNVPITSVQNEVQVVTESAGIDGGTFTLTFAGQTTSALAWDITAANLRTALAALPNIGSTANVTVSGSAGGPYTITFQGTLAGVNVPTLVADWSLATDGGVQEDGTVTVQQAGKSYATGAVFTRDALAFDLRRGSRIEPQRDASKRGTELNATMVYAAGVWRPERGVILRSSANIPLE